MVLQSAVRLVNLYEAWQKPEKARPFSNGLARAGAESKYVLQWAFSRGAFVPDYPELAEAGDTLKQLCGGVSFLATPGSTKAPDLTLSVQDFVARRAEIADQDVSRRLLSSRLAIGWANALDPVEHNEGRRLLAEAALGELRDLGKQIPFDHAEAAAVLGQCARIDGADVEAKRSAAEAWKLLAGGRQLSDWMEANQQIRIARTLLREQMYQPAEELLLPAYTILHDQLGDRHPESQVVIRLLRDLYQRRGRPHEAKTYEELLMSGE